MILRGLGEVHILEIRKQIGGALGIVLNIGDFGDPGIRGSACATAVFLNARPIVDLLNASASWVRGKSGDKSLTGVPDR